MKYSYLLKPVKLSRKDPVPKIEDKTIEQIFQEMGQKGYRYIGYYPSRVAGYGQFEEIDLVFELSTDE